MRPFWVSVDGLVAAAILLFAIANAWRFVDRCYRAFKGSRPDLLAPVVIIGKDTHGANLGDGLAEMLHGRLAQRRLDMSLPARVFELTTQDAKDPFIHGDAANREYSELVAPRAFERLDPQLDHTIPRQLFRPPTIDFEWSGVNVGPIVGWIVNKLYDDRMLRITLHCSESETSSSYTVVGNFGPDPNKRVVLKGEGADSAAVDAIVDYMWRSELESQQPFVRALTDEEFVVLRDVLEKFAVTAARERSGRFDVRQWDAIGSAAEGLTRIAPDWADPHLLVGAARLRATKLEDASRHYMIARDLVERESRLLPEHGKAREECRTRIDQLDRFIAELRAVDFDKLVREMIVSHDDRTLRALGIPENSPPPAGMVSVAVAGGLPPAGFVSGSKLKQIGEGLQSDSAYEKDDEHAANVARMVQLVAGANIETRVAAMRGQSPNEALVKNIEGLCASKPDILAVAYGPDPGNRFPEEVMKAIAKAIEDGIVVVLPVAGNDYSRLPTVTNIPPGKGPGQFMIVAGVDEMGRRAEFSGTAPGALWLPATGIPYYRTSGKAVVGQGVSLSVGLGAGVLARMKAMHPEASWDTILSALRTTSSPLDDAVLDGQRVVDFSGATTKLTTPKVENRKKKRK